MWKSVADNGFTPISPTRSLSQSLESRSYLSVVQSKDTYQRIEYVLGNKSEDESVAAAVDQLCLDCYEECGRLAQEGNWRVKGMRPIAQDNADPDDELAAEAKLLREQIVECNRNSLKQVAAAMGSSHNPLEVEFYEPLTYLEEKVRSLAIEVIAYKLWQIENGSCQPWLTEQIQNKTEELKKNPPRPASLHRPEEDDDDDPGLVLPKRKKRARVTTEESASNGAPKADVDTSRFEQKIEFLMQQLRQMSSNNEQLEQQVSELEVSEARVKNDLVMSSETLAQRDETIADLKTRLDVAVRCADVAEGDEFEMASAQVLRATASAGLDEQRLAAELEVLRAQLAAAKASQPAQRQPAQRQPAQADAPPDAAPPVRTVCDAQVQAMIDPPAPTPQPESETRSKTTSKDFGNDVDARNVNTRKYDCQSQTTMTLAGISSLEAENKRLKLMLEELRAKMGEMVSEGKKAGISHVLDDIVAKVGLRPLVRCGSVFENLYQDAFDRIGRLEKLRERLRQGQDGALSEISRLCAEKNMAAPPKIRDAVQRSQLVNNMPTPAGAMPAPTGTMPLIGTMPARAKREQDIYMETPSDPKNIVFWPTPLNSEKTLPTPWRTEQQSKESSKECADVEGSPPARSGRSKREAKVNASEQQEHSNPGTNMRQTQSLPSLSPGTMRMTSMPGLVVNRLAGSTRRGGTWKSRC